MAKLKLRTRKMPRDNFGDRWILTFDDVTPDPETVSFSYWVRKCPDYFAPTGMSFLLVPVPRHGELTLTIGKYATLASAKSAARRNAHATHAQEEAKARETAGPSSFGGAMLALSRGEIPWVVLIKGESK
jgi:hypothetical protein